jgi:hypothetical protein
MQEGRHVSSARSLLNKKTRTPPVKLLIIRFLDCLCGRELHLHSQPNKVDRLGSSEPLGSHLLVFAAPLPG